MLAEIEERGKRYMELKALLEEAQAATKPQYAGWLREFGQLGKIGVLYEEMIQARKEASEAEALAKDPATDPDFKALAQEEQAAAGEKARQAEASLEELFESQDLDEDSNRNVIVELHAGVGGDEASLFVRDLYEMYKRFADHKGLKITVTNFSEGDAGGFKELSFRVEGQGAFGEMRFEGGGHRVQRVPLTEAQGRIHTSMARVAVLPEAEEVEVHIDPKDVEEKFCGSGGPGGQNVNKVASQCQLHHLPTGVIVHCMETRSQKANQKRAWQILRSKLYALEKAKVDQIRSDTRLGQIGSGDRSERIRTYNFPQGRCTDHRLEGEDKNWPIQDIMMGNLEDLVARLKQIRKQQSRAGSRN